MNDKKDILKTAKRINPHIVKNGRIQSFAQQLIDYLENRYDNTYPMIISDKIRGLEYITDINSNKLLTMNTSTLKKIKKVHSNISCSFISEIEDMLKKSVIGFTSKKFDSTKIIVLDEKDGENNQIIVALRTDKVLATTEVNEITSIYEKNKLFNYMCECFESGKTFYCNKKTKHFIKSYEGFQLPKDLINAFLTINYKGSFNKSQAEEKMKKEKSIQKDLELENDEEIEKLENELDKELNENIEVLEDTKKFKNLDFEDLEF